MLVFIIQRQGPMSIIRKLYWNDSAPWAVASYCSMRKTKDHRIVTDFCKMNEAIKQHPSLLPCMQYEDKAKEEHLTNKLEKDWVPCKRMEKLLRRKMSNIWLSQSAIKSKATQHLEETK